DSGIGSPWSLASVGLGSKVSRWLMPPAMYSQMTRLAFGVTWGAVRVPDQPWAARAAGVRRSKPPWSNPARASEPRPRAERPRKARRVAARRISAGFMGSVPRDGGVEVQDRPRDARPG